MKTRFIPLAALGCALGFYAGLGPAAWPIVPAVCIGLAAPAIALSAERSGARRAGLCLLVVATGLLPGWWSAVRVRTAETGRSFGIAQQSVHTLTGRVSGDSFRSRSGTSLFFLDVWRCADKRGNQASAAARVLVSMSGAGRVFDGEQLQLEAPTGLRALDASLYFARADRRGPRRLDPALVDGLRRGMVEKLLARLQDLGRSSGLVAALLLGFSDGCEPGLVQDFVRSGTVHLLALSGMHLNVVMSLFALLARPLPGRRMRSLVFILGTAAYVFLVGPKPSIIRAFLMFLFSAGADFIGRKSPSIQALGLAFLVYGLCAPEGLLSLSCQLSFLAVTGILVLTPALQRRLGPWLPKPLSAAVCISLAAQAAVSPLLLFQMGAVAPLGVVAGLVLSPLTEILILGGFIYLIMSLAGLPAAPEALALLLNLVYDAIDLVVGAASALPQLSLDG